MLDWTIFVEWAKLFGHLLVGIALVPWIVIALLRTIEDILDTHSDIVQSGRKEQ